MDLLDFDGCFGDKLYWKWKWAFSNYMKNHPKVCLIKFDPNKLIMYEYSPPKVWSNKFRISLPRVWVLKKLRCFWFVFDRWRQFVGKFGWKEAMGNGNKDSHCTFWRGEKGDATSDVLSTKETTMVETPGGGWVDDMQFHVCFDMNITSGCQ